MKRAINEDLGLHAYRRRTDHRLNQRLMRMRRDRSKFLLQQYADDKHRQILFTDEKIFPVEEHLNHQNDRVYATTSAAACEQVPRVQRGHHPI